MSALKIQLKAQVEEKRVSFDPNSSSGRNLVAQLRKVTNADGASDANRQQEPADDDYKASINEN